MNTNFLILFFVFMLGMVTAQDVDKLLAKLEKFEKKLPKLERRIAKKKAEQADAEEVRTLQHKEFTVTKKLRKVELRIAILNAPDQEEALRAEFALEKKAKRDARLAAKAERKAARKAAKAATKAAEDAA